MLSRSSIREPAVAGMFYPEDRLTLDREVDALIKRAEVKKIKGELRGLISPHAGYVYSGYTAASGYRLLEGKSVQTVVIIAPSHREYFRGISVFSGSAYSTPLGILEVDDELRSELVRDGGVIEASLSGHREEHAIEVQLPFLQKVLADFKILPIVMGDQRRDFCVALGKRLGEILKGRKALLVASSDLSHYYPYDIACKLDQVIINDVQEFGEERLLEDLDSQRAEACGGGPIVAMLIAARELGADKVEVLHYCNSGDVTGDKDGVVGYLSAAVMKAN
ncbi:MAG: AmmeMemoRadiSam system protein B [Bacteroidota bacterium]